MIMTYRRSEYYWKLIIDLDGNEYKVIASNQALEDRHMQWDTLNKYQREAWFTEEHTEWLPEQ